MLPLAPSAFHILLALVPGECHGYGIGKAVEATTGGNICLGHATLYRQLRQLADDGWIVETERDDGDAVNRRYYRLTPRGRRAAQDEATRLENLVRIAQDLRLLPAR
jgi:DNA-binding PadR family transcriptional regulator